MSVDSSSAREKKSAKVISLICTLLHLYLDSTVMFVLTGAHLLFSERFYPCLENLQTVQLPYSACMTLHIRHQ